MRRQIVIEMAKLLCCKTTSVTIIAGGRRSEREGEEESRKSVPTQIYIIKSYAERVRVCRCANEFSCKHCLNERIGGIMTFLRVRHSLRTSSISRNKTLTLTAIFLSVPFSLLDIHTQKS